MAKRKQQTEVLTKALPFYEGGTRLHVYPAGTSVSEFSDDALAWLEANRDAPSIKGLFKSRPLTADEAEALTAEFDAVSAELEKVQREVQETAGAIVGAKNAATLRGATKANSAAASRLLVVQKRYDVLSAGGAEALLAKHLAAQAADAEAKANEEREEAIEIAQACLATAEQDVIAATEQREKAEHEHDVLAADAAVAAAGERFELAEATLAELTG